MEYFIEEDVKLFIEKLPPLSEPFHVHLLMLAVRSRKAKEMMGFKCHDLVVEREIIRQNEGWNARYFNSVYNMSILQCHGRYDTPHGIVPMESKGIFATLNPRNIMSATNDLMKNNMELIMKNNSESIIELAKIHSRFFGNLHRHKAKTLYHFVTIDLDEGGRPLLNKVLGEIAAIPIWMVTQTTRGYHIILDVGKPDDAEEYFHNQKGVKARLQHDYKEYKIDYQNDSQEPIAGTLYFKEKGIPNYVQIIQ